MTDVASLWSEACAVRDLCGFQRCAFDALDRKIACVYAECIELEVALHSGVRADIAEELADVALYLVTMLGDLTGGDFSQRSIGVVPSPHHSPEVLTAPIRRYARSAWEAWRRDRRSDALISLELALLETRRLAAALGVELADAMRTKLAFNRRRGQTHGGKRAET